MADIAGKRVVVDVAVAEAIKLRADFKKQISEIEKMIEPLEDRIFPAVADADEVVCDGNVIATYRANKPSAKIDWPAVAAAAAVPADIIAANTTMKPGARVLRVAKSKE